MKLMKNYNQKDILDKWDKLLTKVYEEKGSWDNRKNYQRWSIKEVA